MAGILLPTLDTPLESRLVPTFTPPAFVTLLTLTLALWTTRRFLSFTSALPSSGRLRSTPLSSNFVAYLRHEWQHGAFVDNPGRFVFVLSLFAYTYVAHLEGHVGKFRSP